MSHLAAKWGARGAQGVPGRVGRLDRGEATASAGFGHNRRQCQRAKANIGLRAASRGV